MVRKWVIDTSEQGQEGTEDEMAAAIALVASGEAGIVDLTTEASTPVPFSGAVSGTATPAVGDHAMQIDAFPVPSAPVTVGGSTPGSATPTADSPLPSTSSTIPLVPHPAKPAEEPSKAPDLSLPPAHDAVAALERLELALPIDVEMGDGTPTFNEDEVLLAQEATAGTMDIADL